MEGRRRKENNKIGNAVYNQYKCGSILSDNVQLCNCFFLRENFSFKMLAMYTLVFKPSSNNCL